MYVTFKNNSTDTKMIVTVENQQFSINPENSAEVFCNSQTVRFQTRACAFEELDEILNEADDKAESFKDRILTKLVKKAAKKIKEIAIDTTVTYEITFADSENAVVHLLDGVYSVCDGKIADAFDVVPVAYIFSRAEADKGKIKVTDVVANNRKRFLKLMRGLLLFANWNFILPDLFFFIPEYLAVKICASRFFIKKLFSSLYRKEPVKRERILLLKEQSFEKIDEKGGCLTALLKGLIVLLILGGLILWANSGDTDIIISEDFSSVAYFDETFVRIEGGLPADAEDVFLEEFSAYYPLDDGSYDMDNYFCYIYETPDGARYMWLKDNCTDIANDFKDYEDYENPLVYKSVGETAE